ncbi:hypothetical protein LMG28138_00924 [Pararobbsia alpina]|uniref:Uncharacterized protein n=1 Tax=Pararobbsia alpina TaxID=621374 RepID=A0A6S7AX24_9BURK|nr:hypothetical protein LMG28138_00924 [Pararobbsia alpina]
MPFFVHFPLSNQLKRLLERFSVRLFLGQIARVLPH